MDIMNAAEFKVRLLSLCDRTQVGFITEETVARQLAAAYIDADDKAKADCTAMLREDLAKMKAQ